MTGPLCRATYDSSKEHRDTKDQYHESRYEEAAKEIEDRIEMLKARKQRFIERGLGEERYKSVQREIEELEKIDLDKWRATGRWAQEIWS